MPAASTVSISNAIVFCQHITQLFTGVYKVITMGRTLYMRLNTIEEEPEPEEVLGGKGAFAAPYPFKPHVPTPYFTPEFFFDPNSPPSTPSPLEIAMCIAHRVPVRWRRPVPPAPRVTPVKAFPAFLDHTPSSSQAWANMLRMQLESDGFHRSRHVGLGFDIPELSDRSLHMSLERPPVPDLRSRPTILTC
ncbi:uncharacterized protein PHACADRAFT_88759 [Phanerochaete carnosa HHB-10118-sp]|uniref:Uncharacterized protein n=1 Tax=Phanerochaete carnosa (strain HHB-10118-sp) TaxID=650164 RepID=K5W1P2_PHACS|nr:uncharacterized protein PHACADRAFT_88759 [Phanerochaete carnosa HHB-10118-sp]EKM57773.1 hypothetical protein PHACADRAFT_88759 [Phanerochaete carnosa HHB-10118-sp]